MFLVYNPMVTPDRKFDIQVEYHFFRRNGPGGRADTPVPAVRIRRSRTAEEYFNHTDPQRFNPAMMGARSIRRRAAGDGRAGSTARRVRPGRLSTDVQVTDLLSGQSIIARRAFTVGS